MGETLKPKHLSPRHRAAWGPRTWLWSLGSTTFLGQVVRFLFSSINCGNSRTFFQDVLQVVIQGQHVQHLEHRLASSFARHSPVLCLMAQQISQSPPSRLEMSWFGRKLYGHPKIAAYCHLNYYQYYY